MGRLAILCAPGAAGLESMAEQVRQGAEGAGAQVARLSPAVFAPGMLAEYDAVAFGFAAEDRAGEEAFLALYTRALTELAGRKVLLFGIHADDALAGVLKRIAAFAGSIPLGCCVCGGAPDAAALAACGQMGEMLRPAQPRPDLANTVPIVFSTITGNGYKLAAAVAEAVPDHVGPYNIRYINDEVIEKFDTFVLSYWCNHGTADDDTIALIRRMHGKKLVVIGTLGVATDTQHAAKVCENVKALAAKDNILLGHYLCRGSIDLRRTFARTRIPEGEKGHLSMERFEKQKQSLGHPDAAELQAAREMVAACLQKR